MKLRNKKTGEIIDIKGALRSSDDYPNHYLISSDWEDIPEEPKGSALDLMILTLANFIENEPGADKVDLEDCKQMLEKLKAWKRLEDKGFEFTYWKKSCKTDGKIVFHLDELGPRLANFRDDLNLLFGGEE